MRNYVEIGSDVDMYWFVGEEDEPTPTYSSDNVNVVIISPDKVRTNITPTLIQHFPGLWTMSIIVTATELGIYKCTLEEKMSECLTSRAISSQSFKAIELTSTMSSTIPHFIEI